MRSSAARLFGLAVLAAACHAEPAQQDTSPPAVAVRSFLSSLHDGDCDTAWTYFSASTRAFIEEQSRQMIESEPYYAEVFAPRQLYCRPTSVHRFHQYVEETARLRSEASTRASVSVERHERTGFLLPGFWPTETKISQAELEMVKEGDAWKISLPRPLE